MIIICDICKQYICPSACPSFTGYVAQIGDSKRVCSVCEVRVYNADKYYEKDDNILCSECAEELISPDLLDFLGCSDTKEFFDMLY